MRLKKAILKIGKYQSPDGEIVVTPERLRGWENSFGLMKSRNLGIPVGADHADDAAKTVPVALSAGKQKKRSPLDGVGWLESFKVAADGKSAEITLDIADEKAADKALKNLVEVSPIIYPTWRDGQGKEYSDVITHVDLVHHPVDASQSKFERVPEAIACCLRMAADIGTTEPTLYRMSDDFGKSDDDSSDSGESDKGEETKPEAEPENPDLPNSPDVDQQQLEALIAILAKLGYALPADASQETIIRDLLTVFKNADAMSAKQEADEAKEEKEQEVSQINEASPQFAAMSLQAKTGLAYAEKLHRESIRMSLDTLLKEGKCLPAEHKAKLEGIGAVRLSLDNDGNHQATKLEDWIESRKALPVGAVWDPETKLQRMGSINESAPEIDTELSSELSEAAAEKIADSLFKKRKVAAASE